MSHFEPVHVSATIPWALVGNISGIALCGIGILVWIFFWIKAWWNRRSINYYPQQLPPPPPPSQGYPQQPPPPSSQGYPQQHGYIQPPQGYPPQTYTEAYRRH